MRELGVNVPTAVTFVLGIGFALILTLIFPDPDPDSTSVMMIRLIESLKWLATVIVAFIPLLAWNVRRVVRRDRSINERLRMDSEIAGSLDEQMKSFLQNILSDQCYGVAKCYAFGSVVRRDPTRDVDVIIQFDSSKRRRVRIYRDRLRTVESRFQEFYGRKLHLQTFASVENDALEEFLSVAVAHERIL